MSTDSKNSGCLNFFYIGLALAGLWFVWKLLQLLYSGLNMLALGSFGHLDASYGQMGGAWGYALLGLGLGAAAGAIAAQRRFRLSKVVVAGAVVLIVTLLGAILLGDTAGAAELKIPETTATTEMTSSSGEATADPLPDTALPAPDTASQPAEGWLRVVVSYAPLRAHWSDSTAAPLAYLREEDSVQVLRRAHGWARVQRASADPATAPIGWIRLAGLGPLVATPPSVEPIQDAADNNQPAAVAPADAPDSVATTEQPVDEPTAPLWPTGHRKYTGHVGDLSATFSVDWYSNGAFSGSYYYDQHPRTLYRLVGTGMASGELRVLEFTRGRQTARCVLHRQEAGYAGTMFNTDGRQFPMTLE